MDQSWLAEQEEEFEALKSIYESDISINSNPDLECTTIYLSLYEKIASGSSGSGSASPGSSAGSVGPASGLHYDPLMVILTVPHLYRRPPDLPLNPGLKGNSAKEVKRLGCPQLEFTYDRPDRYSPRKTQWLDEGFIAAARAELERLYETSEGGPILFDIIEHIRTNIVYPAPDPSLLERESSQQNASKAAESKEAALAAAAAKDMATLRKEIIAEAWKGVVIGDPIIDRKSTFQAWALPMTSPDQLEGYLERLLTRPDVRSATHNIWAYRIEVAPGKYVSSYDDDGEGGGGITIAKLLERSDTKNVFVMVTRWFGGILCGPDRFHDILNAAKNVLTKAGWIHNGRR